MSAIFMILVSPKLGAVKRSLSSLNSDSSKCAFARSLPGAVWNAWTFVLSLMSSCNLSLSWDCSSELSVSLFLNYSISFSILVVSLSNLTYSMTPRFLLSCKESIFNPASLSASSLILPPQREASS